jgi:serine/threonine-protein kinase
VARADTVGRRGGRRRGRFLASGSTVADYEIEALVEAGPDGATYAATDRQAGREVLLRVVDLAPGDPAGVGERLRARIAVFAALDHPGLPSVLASGEVPGGFFLATAVPRGRTLAALAGGELPAARALRVLAQVAGALDALHDVGLVHRDVRPEHIVVGPDERTCLTGLALEPNPSAPIRLAIEHRAERPLAYVAPEQAFGDAVPASDRYALACVAFECFSGEVPFGQESEVAVLSAHVCLPVPSISSVRAELPEELDAVFATALAKRTEDRYESAQAFVAALAAGLQVRSHAAAPAPAPAPPDDVPIVFDAELLIASPAEPPAAAPTETAATPEPAAPAEPAAAPPTAAITKVSAVPRKPYAAAPPHAAAPPEPPPPEPNRRARASRLPARVLAAIGLALLALGAAAFLSGRSGGSSPEPPLVERSSADAAVTLPASWSTAAGPAVPGLTFSAPLAFGPAGDDGGGIVAGRLTRLPRDARLLPPAFLRRLTTAPGDGERVALGRLEALRHRGLRVRGASGPVTIYVAPLVGGAAALACVAPAPIPPDWTATCDRAAASLRMADGQPVSVGPSPELARDLGALLDRLAAARRSAGADLAAAATRRAQARELDRIASAYADAARAAAALRSGPVEQGALADLRTSLQGAAAAAATAARAAAGGDEPGFTAARQALTAAERALPVRLAALRRLGYAESG